MRRAAWFLLVLAALRLGLSPSVFGGTWRDHFYRGFSAEWMGDRSSFQTTTNYVLEGVSASPVAESPLNILEIATDSTDCVVGCWINVVFPNTRVCTKGALILRHTGTNGYVFALHEATQTIEVYRLGTREMLLVKAAKIELKRWYYVQAELRNSTMKFFVDGELIGTVNDTVSPSGAVGVAVQDAEPVWFDDFSVSGPNVVGNVDKVSMPELSVVQQTDQEVVLRLLVEAPYDYFVQASSSPFGHNWQTITNFGAKLVGFEAVVSDRITNGVRFYRLEKVHCGCR